MCFRRISFSISTIGITARASTMAAAYSVMVRARKEKARLRNGTKITAAVISTEKISVPQSHLFCFFSPNSDRVRDRMLKEWKISIMLSVRKAMVMPVADSAMPQTPFSSRYPTK